LEKAHPFWNPSNDHNTPLIAHHFDAAEGNTDEQGGAEYNLALGQKRAEAVTKVLKNFGARDAQVEAASFGKEKPKAQGHDEGARAQNRRVDLAYPKD
jgi:peptidoglycan-associated lipoprotein